jgi:hypothetical protein
MKKESDRRWMRRLVRVLSSVVALALMAIPIQGKPIIMWILEGVSAIKG